MNAAEAALEYRARGYSPIPIPPGAKAPVIPGWQNLSVPEDEIGSLFTGNIGLLLGAPSNGLVDVDLDSDIAVELAPKFLPETGMIHGRANKRRSHWWFVVTSPGPTRHFKDPSGAMLVELRSTGGQTVVPPSVHPSGELIEWDCPGDPTEVQNDTLLLFVRRLAAATLLVGHYPAQGSRQDFAMALAGTLLKGGWDEDAVVHFVEAVAGAARDEEADSRAVAARRTAASIRDGKPVTGWRKLTEVVGVDVVRRVSDWLSLSPDRRPPSSRRAGGEDGHAAPNRLEQLLDLTTALELFHTPEDEAFVTLATSSGPEAVPVDSLAFTNWVSRKAIDELGFVPREQLLKELKHQLAGEARHNRPCHRIFIRVAGDAHRIFLDLADEARTVIEVTGDGWRTVQECPVRFFRPAGMQALPLPKPLPDRAYYDELFNTGSPDELRLLQAWMAYAWNPSGPYPILILQGEAGSAKTTLANMVRRIVDPAYVPLRAFPRDERDFVIAARTNHVLCFDNLSGISDRDSDTLCRISTGAGFATRRLFSDFDEVRFQMRRPVLLNGIDDLATRPDLIDRTIVLTLPAIPSDRRQDEATLWRNFESALPYLVGGMLQVLSESMRRQPSVVLRETPRMADFARWSTAAEQALGWPAGGFMLAFSANQRAALEVGIESSVIAAPIRALLGTADTWQGTASQLLHELETLADDRLRRAKTWPRDASRLGNQMRRIAPALRAHGIAVEPCKSSDRARTRLIRLYRMLEGTEDRAPAARSVRRPEGRPSAPPPAIEPAATAPPSAAAAAVRVPAAGATDTADGGRRAEPQIGPAAPPANALRRLIARFR